VAVTPVTHVVAVGAPAAPAQEQAAALAAALEAAGLPLAVASATAGDDVGLEAALSLEASLTVLVVCAGSPAARVRRAVARAAGVPPQELAARAVTWRDPGVEEAWAVAASGRAWAVLPRGAALDRRLRERLLPWAGACLGVPRRLVRTLKVVGPPPAEVEERLRGAVAAPGAVDVAVVPGEGETWVRLGARDAGAGAAALDEAEAAVAARLGADCYGRGDDSLERVVGRLLLERKLVLSVAESCTGGLLGHRLTGVPGSSAWFERGVTVYSNRAKQELLGVPEAVLRAHGAVSAPCAEAMARGMAAASGTPCALAVTGIAGPDGGTPTKPVGTVFIGLAFAGEVTSRQFLFSGDRAAVKWQSAQMALDLLRRRLLATAPR
jgi:nicotinamide-nucleotide amidase